MSFYLFHQNNSGGNFVYDEKQGLSVNVIIEANNEEEANLLAQSKGIYFDGCVKGIDCPCCGDRWDKATSYDKSDEPCIYGKPVDEYKLTHKWLSTNQHEIFVHLKMGTIVGYL